MALQKEFSLYAWTCLSHALCCRDFQLFCCCKWQSWLLPTCSTLTFDTPHQYSNYIHKEAAWGCRIIFCAWSSSLFKPFTGQIVFSYTYLWSSHCAWMLANPTSPTDEATGGLRDEMMAPSQFLPLKVKSVKIHSNHLKKSFVDCKACKDARNGGFFWIAQQPTWMGDLN